MMNRASRALGWSFANTAASRLGTMLIGVVLARVLGPAEFGTYAVAVVALLAVLSFNELGVSLAIVRWPSDPRTIAPTVASISVVMSSVLALTGFAVAPYFSAAMGDPGATGVVRLMMISVLIDGAVATPAAMMQREFMQARRMMIDQVNVWVGALLSITLALSGWGAVSLAIGRISGSLVAGIMFITLSKSPYRFGFDPNHARALLKFGLPLAGASVVLFGVGYSDQLIVGHQLGAYELGFYALAVNLAGWPLGLISQPLRSVAPAAFARLQHDSQQMHAALRSITGPLGAVTLPTCLLMAAAAGPIVSFVYGEEWAPAAGPLTWLAVLAAFKIFFELCYDYLVVLGRSGSLLKVQVVCLCVLIPALFLGAQLGGISGIALAQLVVAAAIVLPIYLWELHRVGVSAIVLWRRVWPAILVAGLGVAATFYLCSVVSISFIAAASAGVLAAGLIAALIYRDREEIKKIRTLGTQQELS